jgi:hypothetical protein
MRLRRDPNRRVSVGFQMRLVAMDARQSLEWGKSLEWARVLMRMWTAWGQ